ncbi:hypothetical protein KV100_07530 [Mumia sp. zg.B21]|uniref:hypothetical protein n=1 Tax=Mumia sp. zg.B21 TaxID=2855447 RepID=UPI001C6EA528|nr:hypothetical protein [Mumia sp. zg.B21]MBW9209503.1 hypothetical protein [Mumia sp. zg.B21]
MRRRRTLRAAAKAGTVVVAWLVPLSYAVLVLVDGGTRLSDVLAYGATWVATTAFPGALAWRILVPRSSLGESVGFGGILGIALLLPWWALGVVTGVSWIWAWPMLLLAVVTLLPAARARLRARALRLPRTRLAWNVAMAAVATLGVAAINQTVLRATPLPPRADATYVDLWYHLALVGAVERGLPPEDPFAVGEPLRYHWFTHADIAATASASGVSPVDVLFHLWLVATLFAFLLALGATANTLARVGHRPAPWWLGPLVALVGGVLALTGLGGLGLGRTGGGTGNGFVAISPTTALSIIVVMAIIGALDRLLRGESTPGVWLVVTALLALGSGTKPTVLPVVACGALLVTAVWMLARRRLHRLALGVAVLCAAIFVLSATQVVGSTGGSRLQPLTTAVWSPAFAGLAQGVSDGTGVLSARVTESSGTLWLAAVLVAASLVTASAKVVGVLAVLTRALRRDPLWWCAAGIVVAGWCASWTLSHPSLAQGYFFLAVAPLGFALTFAAATRLLTDVPTRARAVLFAVSTVVGVATGLVVHALTPSSYSGGALDRALKASEMSLVLVTALLVSLLVLRLVVGLRGGTLVGAAVVLVVCASVTANAHPIADGLASPSTTRVVHPSLSVLPPEQRAALWVRDHTPESALLVTNVFCLSASYREGCRAQGFWVGGLTGRQLLLGAWAYTSENMAADDPTSYQLRQPPWPDRLHVSLAVVERPTARVVTTLRDLGVTHVFADRRATPVSPDLATLARLVHRDGPVSIYALSDTSIH